MNKIQLLVGGLIFGFAAYGETSTKSNLYQVKLDQMVAKYRAIPNFEKALKLSSGASKAWKENIEKGVLEEIKSEKFRWNGFVTACGLGND